MPRSTGVGGRGAASRPPAAKQTRRLLPAAHGPPEDALPESPENAPLESASPQPSESAPPKEPQSHILPHLPGVPGAGNLPGAYWRVAVKRFGLSPRESQVLRSIWTGRKFSLAAREVKMSRHTLDTHWRRIRLKLEVNSLIEAVHKMYEVLISLQMQELREEVKRAARQDVPDDDFAPTSGGP